MRNNNIEDFNATKEKSERGHNGPKPVIAKCCRALLSCGKVDVNYIALL